MPEEKRDYYEVLGISKGASEDEIKKAYRKTAKKYPTTAPDRAATAAVALALTAATLTWAISFPPSLAVEAAASALAGATPMRRRAVGMCGRL